MRCLFTQPAQAFDDCTTIGTTFKLLDSFEGLLDREVIAHDLEKKHTDLLHSYARDLKDVADLFHQYKDRPIVAKNSAPYSGAAYWVRGLMERIKDPMDRLLTMNKMVLESELFREIQRTYDHLWEEMTEYRTRAVDAWCAQVAATSDEKLNLPLLSLIEETADGIRVLGVNFDPALVRLLRETKYFLLLETSTQDKNADRNAEKAAEGGEVEVVKKAPKLSVPDR